MNKTIVSFIYEISQVIRTFRPDDYFSIICGKSLPVTCTLEEVELALTGKDAYLCVHFDQHRLILKDDYNPIIKMDHGHIVFRYIPILGSENEENDKKIIQKFINDLEYAIKNNYYY